GCRELARVELDDEVRLHLHRIGHIGQLRTPQEGGLHATLIDLDVIGHIALAGVHGLKNQRHFTALRLDLDDVAVLQQVGRNVHPLAVHQYVTVVDELARGKDRRNELGPIDDGIQAALQQFDEVLARIPAAPGGLLVVLAELLLTDVAVVALELLLCAELQAIVGRLAAAALAMLAGAILAAVDRSLGATPEVFAKTARNLVL